MQAEKQLNWSIRKALPTDIPFIYSSWLKSYKYDSLLGKSVRSGLFFNNYKEVLDVLLEESQILVACLIDDPNIILGYLVFHYNTIHYCFIKESFRKLGIAKSLYNYASILGIKMYTHETSYSQSILNKQKLNISYNPFLLYKKLGDRDEETVC